MKVFVIFKHIQAYQKLNANDGKAKIYHLTFVILQKYLKFVILFQEFVDLPGSLAF